MASGFPYRGALPYATATEGDFAGELRRILAGLEHAEAQGDLRGVFGAEIAVDATRWTRELRALLKLKHRADPALPERIALTKWYFRAAMAATEPSVADRFAGAASLLWKPRRAPLPQYHPALEFELKDIIDWPVLIRATARLLASDPAAFLSEGNHTHRALAKLSTTFGVSVSNPEECQALAFEQILPFLGHEIDSTAVLRALGIALPIAPRSSQNLADVLAPITSLKRLVTVQVGDLELLPLVARVVRKALHSKSTPFGEYGMFSGRVDVELLFSAVLRIIRIPLAGRAAAADKSHRNYRLASRAARAFAHIVVCSMTPTVLEMLTTLIKTVESFVHPSNSGPYTLTILELVSQLADAAAFRFNAVDEHATNKLSPELMTELSKTLMGPLMLGVHASLPVNFGLSLGAIQTLAAVAPETVVPRVLAEAYSALQGAQHEPHRIVAALGALAHIVRPLTLEPRWRLHASTLCELALPHIDINNPHKAVFALTFVQAVATAMPMGGSDDGYLAAQYVPLAVRTLESGLNEPAPTDIDRELAEAVASSSTAAFADVAPALVQRVLELLDTVPADQDHMRSNASDTGHHQGQGSVGGGAIAADATLLHVAPVAAISVAAAVDAPVYSRIGDLLVEAIAESSSIDALAQLCGGVVRVNAAKLWPRFWLVLNESIRTEIVENGAGQGRTRLPRDRNLVRLLGVLNMCIWASGDAILANKDELADLLLLLRRSTKHAVVYNVANTVHHTITTLLTTFAWPTGPSRIPGSTAIDSEHGWGPNKTNIDAINWHLPSPEGVAFAARVYTDHIDESQNLLNRPGIVEAGGDTVAGNLVFIRTTSGAAALLFDQHATSDPATVPANYPLAQAPHLRETLQAKRFEVGQLLKKVYLRLSADDTAGLKELMFALKVWFADVGYETTARGENLQATLYLYESRLFRVPGLRKSFPLGIIARRANLYHVQRVAHNAGASGGREPTPEDLDLLASVAVDACFSAYPAVRRNAYSAVYHAIRALAPGSVQQQQVYPRLLARSLELTRKGEFERAEGGLGALGYRSMNSMISHGWRYLNDYWEMIEETSAADNSRINQESMVLFSSNVSDAFRLPVDPASQSESGDEKKDRELALTNALSVASRVTKMSLKSLHWRLGVIHAATLVALVQSPQLGISGDSLTFLTLGLIDAHPDTRRTCIHGLLLAHQTVMRTGLIPADRRDAAFCLGSSSLATLARGESTDPDQEKYLDGLSFLYAMRNDGLTSPSMSQGWLVWPSPGEIRGLPIDSTPRLKYLSEDLEQVTAYGRTITPEFWAEFAATRRVEPRLNEDRVDRRAGALVRSFVVLADNGLTAVTLEEMLAVDVLSKPQVDDRNWHRVAAELCMGLVASLVLVEDAKAIEDTVARTLETAFSALAPENVGHWSIFVKYAFAGIDQRRVPRLVSLITETATSLKPESGARDGLRLSLFSDFVLTKFWRLDMRTPAALWANTGHELETVREEVAEALAVLLATHIRRPYKSTDAFLASSRDNLIERLELDPIDAEELVRSFETASLTSAKTLVSVLIKLFRLHCGPVVPALLLQGILGSLLKLSMVRDEPELLVDLTNLFADLRSAPFAPYQLSQAVALFGTWLAPSEAALSVSWHQKVRVLLFMQGFFFANLFVLSHNQRLRLAELACDSLADGQAEVRMLAADTLGGILRCSPPVEQAHIVESLSRKFTLQLEQSADRIERHAAVLGLGAMVNAFPYVSPPPLWVPKVLATLAIHAADNAGIVGASVKQTLGDFKKTRQDTWHIDQTVFSQDELDYLEGVLWKNYFA